MVQHRTKRSNTSNSFWPNRSSWRNYSHPAHNSLALLAAALKLLHQSFLKLLQLLRTDSQQAAHVSDEDPGSGVIMAWRQKVNFEITTINEWKCFGKLELLTILDRKRHQVLQNIKSWNSSRKLVIAYKAKVRLLVCFFPNIVMKLIEILKQTP